MPKIFHDPHKTPPAPFPTYLMCGPLPPEMQRRLIQLKVYHMFFYFVGKETTHKPLKVVPAKTLFSSTYVITSFNECFLFYVITRRHYVSQKFIVTLRLFYKCHADAFFEASVLKQVRISCVISTVTIRC